MKISISARVEYAYIKKMGRDANKPYKYSSWGYYILRDLSQPIRGALNLIRAVINVGTSPLIFLGFTVASLFPKFRKGKSFFATIKEQAIKQTSQQLQLAGALAVHGILQVVMGVPLIPYRLFLTAKQRSPRMLDSENFQNLVKIANAEATKPELDNAKLIDSISALMMKFSKAKGRGRALGSQDNQQIKKAFQELVLMKLPKNITTVEASEIDAAIEIGKIFKKATDPLYVDAARGIYVQYPSVEKYNSYPLSVSPDEKWLLRISNEKIPPFISLFQKPMAARAAELATPTNAKRMAGMSKK